MPIVYVLLAAIGLTVLGVRMRGSRAAALATPVSTTAESNGPSLPAPLPLAGAEPTDGGQTDGILRTTGGVRRKVVIKVLGERCKDAATGGKTVGPLLDYFSIHFVYGEDGVGNDAVVQIGPGRPPALGWIRRSAVFEWDTRLMALPTAEVGRPVLDIYKERDCLIAVVNKADCSRHRSPETCPVVGSEPAADSAGRPLPVIGLPILQSENVAGAGDAGAILQVAALVRETVPPRPPAEPPEDLKQALRQIYIAFVIDTTNSMRPAIDAVRKVVDELSDERSPRFRGLSLRVALVEYRDRDPGFPRAADFRPPAALRPILSTVEPAPRGDGTIPEAVFDGVSAALPAAGNLSWPSGPVGEASTKLLVLIGDAPDHAKDLARAAKLADEARKSRITIAAVRLTDPLLSRSEAANLREQWRALAEECYRPEQANGAEKGLLPPILPVISPEASADRDTAIAEIRSRIQALIGERARDALRIAEARQTEAENRLNAYANSQRLTLDQLAPVLLDLHRGEKQPEYHQDPRFQGQKAPSIRVGWVAGELSGKRMVTTGVLMTHEELGVLIDELEAFEQAAEGARDISELRRIGMAAAAGETAFLAVDRGNQTLAQHLERQGFPPPRKGSLLGRTQADLLQADALYRGELRAKLREVIPRLDKIRQSPEWKNPLKAVDGMRLVPYEVIEL
jgi:hypothetical protein